MPRTTEKAAPALMPSRSGDASGLLVIACMMAPALASPAPASNPAITRGNLMVSTTTCCRDPSKAKTALTTSMTGMETVPTVAAQIDTITTSAPVEASMGACKPMDRRGRPGSAPAS